MAEASTRTVERALSLLGIICAEGRINLADASRTANLAPSTALRLIRTLEASGFVRKGSSGDYFPGSRLIQLGAQALSNESLVPICRNSMERIAEETGESVYLSVEGHQQTALYIAIVEGTHSVRHTSWVGRSISLDSSSAGQVLRGKTPMQGFVVVERGVESDITAIAAPIFAGTTVVAALSVVVPSYRIDANKIAQYGDMLAAEAHTLSSGFGSADTDRNNLEATA